jgi:hypothetical protein
MKFYEASRTEGRTATTALGKGGWGKKAEAVSVTATVISLPIYLRRQYFFIIIFSLIVYRK